MGLRYKPIKREKRKPIEAYCDMCKGHLRGNIGEEVEEDYGYHFARLTGSFGYASGLDGLNGFAWIGDEKDENFPPMDLIFCEDCYKDLLKRIGLRIRVNKETQQYEFVKIPFAEKLYEPKDNPDRAGPSEKQP